MSNDSNKKNQHNVHSTSRQLLDAYSTGELEAETLEMVQRHLASCPECARQLREIQRFRVLLGSLANDHTVRTTTFVNNYTADGEQKTVTDAVFAEIKRRENDMTTDDMLTPQSDPVLSLSPNLSRKGKWQQRLVGLVAALITVVIVGSLILTLTHMHSINKNQVGNGKQAKALTPPSLLPPFQVATVVFDASVSYDQALEIVTNLGMRPFIPCIPFGKGGNAVKETYMSSYGMDVMADVNVAPLWLEYLKVTPHVKSVNALESMFYCPVMPAGTPLPKLVERYIRVTFAQDQSYASMLEGSYALGLRMAAPCYEHAYTQGSKPQWSSMGQEDTFAKNHTLVLETGLSKADIWKGLPGIVRIEDPLKIAC